jgi:hypothetical protein
MKKLLTKIGNLLVSLLAAGILLGCASTPPKVVEQGKLRVVYTNILPNQSASVKYMPNVTVIKASSMIKGNALGILLAPLTLIGGGEISVNTSKYALMGENFLTDKGQVLVNPLHDGREFLTEMQLITDTFIEKTEGQKSKSFKNGVNITNGYARLVYEELTGEKSNQYRLNVVLFVYKKFEQDESLKQSLSNIKDALTLQLKPRMVQLDCSHVSDNYYSLEQWQQDDAKMLRSKLKDVGELCKSQYSSKLMDFLQ